MPNLVVRRLRAAYLVMRQLPERLARRNLIPIVWIATLFVAFFLAMHMPQRAVDAFGQRGSVGVSPPSLSLYGYAQITEDGVPVPLPNTATIGPLRMDLSLLGPLDFTSFLHKSRSAITHVASDGSIKVLVAMLIWLVLSSCLVWFVAWFAINRLDAIRHRLTGMRYARATRLRFRRTIMAVWLACVVMCVIGTLGLSQGHSLYLQLLWFALPVVGSAVAGRLTVVYFSRRRVTRGKSARHVRTKKRVQWATAIIVAVVVALTAGRSLAGQSAHGLDTLVGYHVVHVDPPAGGPIDKIDEGAVIGDSRASFIGGTHATGWCHQTDGALADQLTQLFTQNVVVDPIRFRQLACSGASIEQGLLGPQYEQYKKVHHTTPPQVGQLKNMPNLKYVVVMIGPNDVLWSAQLGLCIVPDSCTNTLTSQVDFNARVVRFAFAFNDLLEQLNALPTHPQIYVVLSYNAFSPATAGTKCQDAGSFTASDLQLMVDDNGELNHYEQIGAQAFGATVIAPVLTELCQPGVPMIQHLYLANGSINPDAMHPTLAGETQISEQVYGAILGKLVNGQDTRFAAVQKP